MTSTVGGLLLIDYHLFPFHLYVQFDIAHNHSVVTSNVDMADGCYVCDDVWPVCSDAVNVGLVCTFKQYSIMKILI